MTEGWQHIFHFCGGSKLPPYIKTVESIAFTAGADIIRAFNNSAQCGGTPHPALRATFPSRGRLFSFSARFQPDMVRIPPPSSTVPLSSTRGAFLSLPKFGFGFCAFWHFPKVFAPLGFFKNLSETAKSKQKNCRKS